MNFKIINPASTLIEQTAADMAASYYEIGRSQGLKSKSKTHKNFVHHNIEHFIPLAVQTLVDMLGMPHIPQEQKDLISEALLERANDPELSFMNEKLPIFKEPENRIEILRTSAFDKAWDKSRKG